MMVENTAIRTAIAAMLIFGGAAMAQVPPPATSQEVAAAAQAAPVLAGGAVEPTWESIRANYQTPDWFRDAKFGIMMHWGLYSVPAHASEWYAKHMYGNAGITAWHTQHFGALDTFGYKDFIPLFTAKDFDPDAWATLFRKAGAKYVIPTAEHHDGFALWDSQVNPWNAKAMGPHRDLIGDLGAAVRRAGLKFGVSHHGIEHFNFITPTKGQANDLSDPKWAGFYSVADRSDAALTTFLENWVKESVELIDKYQPDILWYDNGINPRVLDPLKLKVAAYYYNQAKGWGKQVSFSTKGFDSPEGAAFQSGTITDFERSSREPKQPTDFPWEVDEPVLQRFGYTDGSPIATSDRVIRLLVDCVSKNGTLLLNISPKADGTIPADQQKLLLEIGAWLDTNGEAIYGTRPWSQHADGSARYTKKGDALYATFIGKGGDVPVLKAVTPAGFGKVSEVTLVGSGGKLNFTQTDAGLKVEMPVGGLAQYPAIKITTAKAAAAAPAKTAIFADEIPGGFGMVEDKRSYIVNTGAHTVFEISRANGDMTSIKFNGRELEAPIAKANRYSHYESGLGKNSKITAEKDPAGQWIKITCEDAGLGVTHYYVARKGYDNIYMATYAEKLPAPGEMRYMAYLDKDVFTHVPVSSNISLADTTIEGKDMFKNSKTGTTYSKFYGATQIIDNPYHGITGNGVGAFMNMGSRERSSHGPFFRDIENQTTGGAAELYNYMYSGHTPTEPYRPGLKGPYALQLTDGSKPAPIDYAFMADLKLEGYVPASKRGAIAGQASGVPKGNRPTVTLANATAQYWATPDAAGKYSLKGVLPGTYTETLFNVELAIATKPVTVSAGQTTHSDIAGKLLIPPAIFRIGEWDGTPRGFLNFEKFEDHHPTDVIMTPFTNINFVVGESKASEWPVGQWKDVNNDLRITFNLTAEQARTPLTLRVGISLAYADGRSQIDVNQGKSNTWTSPLPEVSNQPKQSRGITRGIWRGNNDMFAFDIPPAALQEGTNTIDLHVGGGIRKPFPGFLSPNVTFDAVDLVTTHDAKEAALTISGK